MPSAHRGLILYKRHLRSCPLKKNKLKPSVRRFRMDCECPIWIVGRTPSGEIVPRQSTGETELRRAEAVRDSILRQTKNDVVHGAAIAECVDQYLASRKDEMSERTLAQHRLVLDRLISCVFLGLSSVPITGSFLQPLSFGASALANGYLPIRGRQIRRQYALAQQESRRRQAVRRSFR